MKATAPQVWEAEGWIASPCPPRHRDKRLARCRYCKQLISFPNAVDLNGKHHPVFDRNVWRDGNIFWHEDCEPEATA